MKFENPYHSLGLVRVNDMKLGCVEVGELITLHELVRVNDMKLECVEVGELISFCMNW